MEMTYSRKKWIIENNNDDLCLTIGLAADLFWNDIYRWQEETMLPIVEMLGISGTLPKFYEYTSSDCGVIITMLTEHSYPIWRLV